MNRRFLFDDASLWILCIGLSVFGDHIDPFHDRLAVFPDHLQHTALLALVLSDIDICGITPFDMKFLVHPLLFIILQYFRSQGYYLHVLVP